MTTRRTIRCVVFRLTPLLALLFLSPLAAQIKTTADSVLDRARLEHNIPALSAGISIDGRIRWVGAAGFVDLENGVPATPDSRFRIASISKVLTATATMKLMESGVIDLNAPVRQYLRDYPATAKGELRVIDLLSHTSGIRHYRGDENRTLVHYESLRDACRVFEDRRLAFAPGTGYRYTSYGFTVLGAVMEAATGESYRTVMRKTLWRPAGMTNTDLDGEKDSVGNRAKLYVEKGGKIVPDVENDLSVIFPAGGVVSTAQDLLNFVIGFEAGSLVSRHSMQRMLEPPLYKGKVLEEHAGLGWNVWTHQKHGQVYHRVGGQSGTSALLISYRDKGVAVALLTNKARLDPIWEIVNQLIGIGIEATEGP